MIRTGKVESIRKPLEVSERISSPETQNKDKIARKMALIDSVCDEIVQVFQASQQRIALCGAYRISCEGWLKIELLLRLDEVFSSDTPSVACEANRVDLSVSSHGETVLIELKTFPTNYGASGKPITNFIDGVIEDLQKLAGRCSEHTVGIAVWLAYPVPASEPSAWAAHVQRVNAQAAGVLRSEQIPLWENKTAHLYITQCKSTAAAAGTN